MFIACFFVIFLLMYAYCCLDKIGQYKRFTLRGCWQSRRLGAIGWVRVRTLDELSDRQQQDN